MKTLIITDVRVYKHENKYYIKAPFFRILQRYRNKFSNLELATRVTNVAELQQDYLEITEMLQKIIDLKSIINVVFGKNNKAIKEEIFSADFIILRLHSLISILLSKYVIKYKKIYMTEIVGCAWDAYWNHSIIGKLVAPYVFFKMKKIVYNANYALYVTNTFLQNRYPCKNYSVGISNVNINSVETNRDYNINKKEVKVMTSAAVDVKYKGQQYVIRAIKKLEKEGIHIEYYLAGGGNNSYLKKISKKNNVEKQVHFLGSLKHEDLLKKLDTIDLYIQPSLQEGLPRAVIEAMSRGCVCLGAKTAGIPELLDKPQIFKRKSVKDIVLCIRNNINNCDLSMISGQNIEKAKSYISDTLNNKRNNFYDKIIKEISITASNR